MLIIKKILYILNLLCAIALLFTYTSAFLPQDVFSKISLFGYFYPLFLLVNVIFIILWLLLKPRHALLSLIVIGIRFDYVIRLVNYSPNQEGGELKVLTYNVHDFIHGKEEDNSLRKAVLEDSILMYIASTKADVVCLQDYDVNISLKNGFHQQMVESLGYHNFYYYDIQNKNVSNTAIYSKYSITDANSVIEDSETKNFVIYADVKTPYQVVRIYNLHLKSYMLGSQEKKGYKRILRGNVTDSVSKNIIAKLLDANKYRAGQIRTIVPSIERQQKATIICGDFNDHPFSHTYRKFSKYFKDSFVTKGSGIGRTYNGVFPAYRIDYIWYDANRLECMGYSSESLDYSDHYPILSIFKIKRQ